jgi:hypothetical protein
MSKHANIQRKYEEKEGQEEEEEAAEKEQEEKKRSLCKQLYINYISNFGKETRHMRLTRLIPARILDANKPNLHTLSPHYDIIVSLHRRYLPHDQQLRSVKQRTHNIYSDNLIPFTTITRDRVNINVTSMTYYTTLSQARLSVGQPNVQCEEKVII